MELGSCDFCLRSGRKKNLAKVTWLTNMDVDYFCPHCLPEVIEDMKATPWVQKDGYIVEYPFKEE
ncbi:MAG: hypothetical protein ACQET8_23210 [Bacillota bacterium]